MPLVPDPKNCDISVKRAIQGLSKKLGYTGSPTHANITLTDLTASSLVGTNALKLMESVTVGTGLDYTRPNLTLSHLGIEALTDPGADRIFFWDDNTTAAGWLVVGNSIVITTTTIDTIQDIRTSASPQFTGIELGHASDTTITRASAGNLNIEGNLIYRTGGTDVPIADGGTGASSASAARTNLGLVIGTDTQAWDAGLDSVAGLTYAAAAFVKMTGANTFVLRTLQQTSDDLEATIDHDNLLNFAANEHYLQSAITTVGTIGTGVWEGTSIAVGYTDAKCVAVWPDTYTADQNLLIASSPTFAGLDILGAIDHDTTVAVAGVRNFSSLTLSNPTENITTVVGTEFEARHNSTFQLTGNLTAMYCIVRQNSTGLIALARGGSYNVYNTSTGDITAARTLDIGLPYFSSTGTIGTLYGLYLSAQAHANVTTAYGIYQVGASDINYLVGNTGIGILPVTKLTVEGTLTLKEQAAADADTAAYGQIWIKSDTPNILMFTDDAGTDFTVNVTAV